MQIVVDPGNLVPRKNLSSKKIVSKIHALLMKNNCFDITHVFGFKFYYNYHSFFYLIIFFDLKYVENHSL